MSLRPLHRSRWCGCRVGWTAGSGVRLVGARPAFLVAYGARLGCAGFGPGDVAGHRYRLAEHLTGAVFDLVAGVDRFGPVVSVGHRSVLLKVPHRNGRWAVGSPQGGGLAAEPTRLPGLRVGSAAGGCAYNPITDPRSTPDPVRSGSSRPTAAALPRSRGSNRCSSHVVTACRSGSVMGRDLPAGGQTGEPRQ